MRILTINGKVVNKPCVIYDNPVEKLTAEGWEHVNCGEAFKEDNEDVLAWAGDGDTLHGCFSKARAAIAKAEGKQ